MQRSRVTCRAAAVSVLGLLWVVTAAFTCPETCDCGSDGLVDCSKRGLTVVPANIPLGTTVLHMEDNYIHSLSDADFSYLTSLEWLDLSNNDIRVLPAGVFSHLTSLWWLDLSGNHIADLPEGVISHLTSLWWLDLSGNHIADLPDGVFSHLTSLEWLDLSGNHIADLPDGVFSHLTSLERLYLSNNNISSLPTGVFSHLTSLQDLYIAGNPWRCDCWLNALLTSARRRGLIADIPLCSSPPHMEGDALFSVTADTVCQSRGHCTTGNADGTCACNFGSTGPYCGKEHNLAFRKTASQSSTVGYTRGAEKAVDGFWRAYSKAGCSSTDREYRPWWKVDLEGYYTVSWVNIRVPYSINTAAGTGITLTVRVGSNEDFTRNGQCGQNYTKEEWNTRLFILSCNPPMYGRYVSVQAIPPENVNTASLELCEVEVYVKGTCCNDTISILNGHITASNGFCSGDSIQFSCDTGYELVGSSFAVCRDTHWRQDIPTCQRICCNATEIMNGVVNSTDGYCFGNEIQFSCNPGYELVGRSSTTCGDDGSWGRELPTCQRICCDHTLGMLNGKITATDGYCSGNDIQFSCHPGYELVGRSNATCQNDGSWDGEIPTCQRTCCNNTISILNGQITANNGFCSGNLIQFSCDTGHELVGSSFAVCRDKHWEQDIPTCQRICCNATEIMNGMVSATDGYCFGNDIQFSCNPGYELVGRSSATCEDDGSWGRELPTCQRICCDHTISILNGKITVTDGYCSGNDIQFSCDLGYELVGRSSATCLNDGSWEGEIPTCQRICCNATEIMNGVVNATYGYCFGNEIQFSCNPGYELVGRSSATCKDDGSWGRDLPSCQLPSEQSLTSIGAIIGGAIGAVIVIVTACKVGNFIFKQWRGKKIEKGVKEELEHLMGNAGCTYDGRHKYDVFISYSSKEESWVRGSLLADLESNDYIACLDKRDFPAGNQVLIYIKCQYS